MPLRKEIDVHTSIASRRSLAGALSARPGRLRRRRGRPPKRRAGGSDRAGGGAAGGTIAIITVDPSNPYWKAEADTAEAEAKKLGYKTTRRPTRTTPRRRTS